MNAIYWFRSDLRIGDNPNLLRALNEAQRLTYVHVLEDRNWLNRVTLTLQQYWLGKNERRAKPIFSARPTVSMGGAKRMTQSEDKLAIQ